MAEDSVVRRHVELAEARSGVKLRCGRRFVLVVSGLTGTRPGGHFIHLVVKDAQGAIKGGVEVRVHHGGAMVASAVTDDEGLVHIPGLPESESYEIEIGGHHADHGGAAGSAS